MAKTKLERNVRPFANNAQLEVRMCTRCKIRPRRTQQSANATWCAECACQYAKEKRALDYASGICMRCPNARREDSIFCQNCADKKAKYRKGKRDIVKQQIIEYLGGACVDCGLVSEYTDVYDCHHLDESKKDLNIGQELSKQRTFEDLKSELDKVVLVCSNCHRIRHQKQRENKETNQDGNRCASAPSQPPRDTAGTGYNASYTIN